MDNIGWISGAYIATDPDSLYVTAGVLNVRSAPNTGGAIVGTRSYGQLVTVYGSATNTESG